MANVHVFKQNYRTVAGAWSESLGGEGSDLITTPTFVSMANYDLTIGFGQVSNITSDDVVTLTMYEATATDGSGSAAITGASDTYTSTQATDLDVLVAQVRGEDLSSGFQYVGAKLSVSGGNTGENANVFLAQGRARYKQATMPA